MKKKINLIIMTLFSIMLSINYAKANITIDIESGSVSALSTVILDFQTETANEKTKSLGADMAQVIRNDLSSSKLFRMMNPRTFLRQSEEVGKAPNFTDWQAINAKVLVYGKITERKDKKLRVEFYAWDVALQEQKEAQALITDYNNWRRIAHIISDYIYTAMTGESGYFDTRIVYISETGEKINRKRRLAIMDYDGENHKFLTDGLITVATPVFAPDMQKIAYMTYVKNTPVIYIYDLETGKQENLGKFPGMSFAPRFSPDGKKLALALAKDGITNIYEYTIATKQMKQLTFSNKIDTSPSYSPDGKKMVFVSDRKNDKQELYLLDLTTNELKQISKGSGLYEEPAWSPRGDYIAFVKIQGGKFYLGVMKPDGTGERLITNDFMVESVSWAPNGRRILYYKQLPMGGGVDKVRIYSIDVSGRYETQMKTPLDGSDPSWSSLLP